MFNTNHGRDDVYIILISLFLDRKDKDNLSLISTSEVSTKY